MRPTFMTASLFKAGSRHSLVVKIVKRQFASQPTPEGTRAMKIRIRLILAVASPLVMLCFMVC